MVLTNLLDIQFHQTENITVSSGLRARFDLVGLTALAAINLPH